MRPLRSGILLAIALTGCLPTSVPPKPLEVAAPARQPRTESGLPQPPPSVQAPAPAPEAEGTPAVVPSPKEIRPLLTTRRGRAEERRLTEEAHQGIQAAEQMLTELHAMDLARPQREMVRTIESFLIKARVALSREDFEAALMFVDKVRGLAEEILPPVDRRPGPGVPRPRPRL